MDHSTHYHALTLGRRVLAHQDWFLMLMADAVIAVLLSRLKHIFIVEAQTIAAVDVQTSLVGLLAAD